MSSIPTITIDAGQAARAYRDVASGASFATPSTGGGDVQSFGSALSRALEGAAQAGTEADTKSMQAISGQGNLTDVVTAVSRANLALQTTVAIRDRVVQAYQDIMHMSI